MTRLIAAGSTEHLLIRNGDRLLIRTPAGDSDVTWDEDRELQVQAYYKRGFLPVVGEPEIGVGIPRLVESANGYKLAKLSIDVFCATGKGGGVDPTCGEGKGKGKAKGKGDPEHVPVPTPREGVPEFPASYVHWKIGRILKRADLQGSFDATHTQEQHAAIMHAKLQERGRGLEPIAGTKGKFWKIVGDSGPTHLSHTIAADGTTHMPVSAASYNYPDQILAWHTASSKEERSSVKSWAGEGYTKLRQQFASGTLDEKGKALEAALLKAPVHAGTMFRGLQSIDASTMAKLHALKPGDVWTDAAPASHSADLHSARHFSGATGDETFKPGTGGNTAMLIVTSKTGRAIQSPNNETSEHEVVSLPGTKFRITHVAKDSAIVHKFFLGKDYGDAFQHHGAIIHMEEI
jgi:hypothetical protein